MSIINCLNKLCNTKNDLVNILKPFNSSINSNSKYDELVTYVNTISNDALSTKIYTNVGEVINVIRNGSFGSKNFGTNQNDFNTPVIIGDNVCECAHLFYDVCNYNSLITFGDSVTNCYFMFGSQNGCETDEDRQSGRTYDYCHFNQSINIPTTVTNCRYMFYHCFNFNKPVNFVTYNNHKHPGPGYIETTS